MSFIFTPGQLSRRGDFYYQLGQLTAAGVGLIPALQMIQKQPPSSYYRQKLGLLTAELTHGFTLTESLKRVGQWLPAFDVALLQAGEHSGRLDACFRLLSSYYTDRARIARQMIGDLAYSAFLCHFAVFILPFAKAFTSNDWVTYCLKVVGVLLPIYVIIFAVVLAAQSRHGEKWRSFMERMLTPVPVLGKARRSLALGRLCGALAALLNAGVTIIEAWELAANASGSPALRRIVTGWRPLVDAGQTPAEAVLTSRRFPELFVTQYASGEISGKLDDTLQRLQAYYLEEGSRKLHMLAQWSPRFVYMIVAIAIGYKVVSFWSDYFKQVGAAAGW